jgi:cell division protein FtsQ
MWHNVRLLNLLANTLYVIAGMSLLYTLVLVIVRLPIFPIREIKVSGDLAHVNQQQVKLIADEYIKGNFFTLDLIKTRDAFEKLPWANTVTVRRRWPDSLSVEIEEHKALARWGNIALVNKQGVLFHAATDANLPVFYGPSDAVEALSLSYVNFNEILKGTDIKIIKINLSSRRSWEIQSEKNLLIALGRVDVEKRLRKFSAAYQKTIKPLNIEIKYADLRYPNGFAVRKPKKLSTSALSVELGKASGRV